VINLGWLVVLAVPVIDATKVQVLCSSSMNKKKRLLTRIFCEKTLKII
jgi:hypothetical protein